MQKQKSFDERLNEFISAVEYPYTKDQAIDVFLNTCGLDFSHPTGAVMTAMLARNNNIRIYASRVSSTIWFADSLHNYKGPIYVLNGTLTDLDMENSYILNEFMSKKEAGDRGDVPRIWWYSFKSIEDYKRHFNVA